MTVSRRDGVIVLSGDCPSEDAETLLGYVIADPGATVDWAECTAAHTAVIQVLVAARRPLTGPSRSAFLTKMVEPLLQPR